MNQEIDLLRGEKRTISSTKLSRNRCVFHFFPEGLVPECDDMGQVDIISEDETYSGIICLLPYRENTSFPLDICPLAEVYRERVRLPSPKRQEAPLIKNSRMLKWQF